MLGTIQKIIDLPGFDFKYFDVNLVLKHWCVVLLHKHTKYESNGPEDKKVLPQITGLYQIFNIVLAAISEIVEFHKLSLIMFYISLSLIY